MPDDQLSRWMNDQRASNEAARQATAKREAAFLGHAAAGRAAIANGSYTKPAEWTPPRTVLGDFISKEVSGIDLSAAEETNRPDPGDEAADWAWRHTPADQRQLVLEGDPEATAAVAARLATYDPAEPGGQHWRGEIETDAQGIPL
jgi:hypothetical protein